MFKNLQKKDQQGFTIIEVLIVLAIAGLILLIVLIAVPQLQKNQRNEARRNVLSRISTEVNNFTGNNQGTIPADTGTGVNVFDDGFADRYLGNPIRDTFKMPNGTDPTLVMNPTGATAIAENEIHYNAGATCNGEIPNGSGSGRDFAIAIGLEGGASYCVDNGTN